MTAAVVNSNTRAIPAEETRAAASSTLALSVSTWEAFFPLLASVLRMDSLRVSSFMWFWGTFGNSREISPESSFIEKEMKAGTYERPLLPSSGRRGVGRGFFQRTQADAHRLLDQDGAASPQELSFWRTGFREAWSPCEEGVPRPPVRF